MARSGSSFPDVWLGVSTSAVPHSPPAFKCSFSFSLVRSKISVPPPSLTLVHGLHEITSMYRKAGNHFAISRCASESHAPNSTLNVPLWYVQSHVSCFCAPLAPNKLPPISIQTMNIYEGGVDDIFIAALHFPHHKIKIRISIHPPDLVYARTRNPSILVMDFVPHKRKGRDTGG